MANTIKLAALLSVIIACNDAGEHDGEDGGYNEPHRPQIHFSPKEKWMNDPNGLVYYDNRYHLFYQYYPDSTVWGPMHWGHATSTDLLHWEHQPVALYPDSLGYIFSGSAVVDENNTSGFGEGRKAPLVAIFTHHDPIGAAQGRNDYQYQSIAYSLDGIKWTKYAGNPVLKNPGIKDFRDPKVMWHEPSKKWIMSLATLDRITFYSSPDLKQWAKESEFGKDMGAHGGVWECPDLFSFDFNGEKIWALLVSINPGGPNGGSATQYFMGKFDGKEFVPLDTVTRWLDHGPDNYAGVTWSNIHDRRIFIGWMSNWQYGTVVPTEKWRSAMTMPRLIEPQTADGKYVLTSNPIPEISRLKKGMQKSFHNLLIEDTVVEITTTTDKLTGPAMLTLKADDIKEFAITLSNDLGQRVVIGYDKAGNHYYIDRTTSGKTDFEKGFGARNISPRVRTRPGMSMTLIIDNSSVEMFADDGLNVMTAIFFPDKIYSKLAMASPETFRVKSLSLSGLKSIYRKD
ncbi:MAG TPA: glycoside hydrolase family 32 protein [Chitinophagaceae bacterium]|nr:glycoside hydrolase family 32 protein [Chitinophagaceae bacterium]